MSNLENVGNIVLDLSYYPGQDLYSDGPIEDLILKIVMENDEDDFNKIIYESHNWPVLYHLSHMRQNIVDVLPITKSDSVLEIGSGCGAITGALADKAKKVDCVELSKKRSTINAHRNKKYNNICIKVGNFEDIEKNLEEKYDYITLIGVLEYGAAYINSSEPYSDFLKMVKNHLNKNGKIVIAIENKLGLKYFAGCKEDHTGRCFEGIEGYPTTNGVCTFGRTELEKLIKDCGYSETTFYYPYPDYKLPKVIYSDDYLPQIGELNDNVCNYDGKRMILFDDAKVFDSIIKENLFPYFSNSFLVIASV